MRKHLDSEGRRTAGKTIKGKGESQKNKKEIKRLWDSISSFFISMNEASLSVNTREQLNYNKN